MKIRHFFGVKNSWKRVLKFMKTFASRSLFGAFVKYAFVWLFSEVPQVPEVLLNGETDKLQAAECPQITFSAPQLVPVPKGLLSLSIREIF